MIIAEIFNPGNDIGNSKGLSKHLAPGFRGSGAIVDKALVT